MKKAPKTHGLTWLEHSLTAFNGSGMQIEPTRKVRRQLYNLQVVEKKPEAAEWPDSITKYFAAQNTLLLRARAGKAYPICSSTRSVWAFKLHGIL